MKLRQYPRHSRYPFKENSINKTRKLNSTQLKVLYYLHMTWYMYFSILDKAIVRFNYKLFKDASGINSSGTVSRALVSLIHHKFIAKSSSPTDYYLNKAIIFDYEFIGRQFAVLDEDQRTKIGEAAINAP